MQKALKTGLVISLIANCAIFYVGYKAYEYRTHINHFLEKYLHVSQEFSARETYNTANLNFQADSTVSNRIVFFGTQVTENYDLTTHFPEYEALNRGITGQRFAGYLLRFKPDVLDLSPKAVVLEISSYNFRPENSIIELQDYTELLVQLSRFNHVTPILTTIIKPCRAFSDVVEIKELGEYNVFDSVVTYNKWLRKFADRHNVQLVDATNLLGDNEGFLRERNAISLVDLNEAGYKILTEAIKLEIEKIK